MRGAHALDGLAVHDHGLDGFVHAEVDAQVPCDGGHALTDASQSTHGVEDTVFVLEESEHGEEAGAVEGRHAEVLRLEGHGEHESVIIEEFHQVASNRTLGAKHAGDSHGSLGEQVGCTVPWLLEASL